MAPRFTIYRAICLRLEAIYRILDATECFHRMASELGREIDPHYEQEKWVLGEELRVLCECHRSCDRCSLAFKHRCCGKLENIGDVATDARRHDVAITHYSAALSLDPADPRDIFIKRSKARMTIGLWKDALDDANQACHFRPTPVHSFRRRIIR
jgi:tetratricopeptide (TPR) repeat protein